MTPPTPPDLRVTRVDETLWRGRSATALAPLLPRFLRSRRWFGGKARPIRDVGVADVVGLPAVPGGAWLLFARVRYRTGPPETYLLLLTVVRSGRGSFRARPADVVARLRAADGASALLVDGAVETPVAEALLSAFSRRLRGRRGVLVGTAGPRLRQPRGRRAALTPSLLGAEQSNTSIAYGRRLILKLYRRLQPGVQPDLEIGRYLSRRGFAHTPALAGSLEYQRQGREPTTVALLQQFVANRGDAWRLARESLADYFRRTAGVPPVAATGTTAGRLLALAAVGPSRRTRQVIGPFLVAAALLGRRTGELHMALTSDPTNPAFHPEPFTAADQRALSRALRRSVDGVLALLGARAGEGGPDERWLLDHRTLLERRCAALSRHPVRTLRIRGHGDYHLGQVLFTGRDFLIIDFEGEPARPLWARRQKHPALRDVAGMLRSFHYAAHAVRPGGGGGRTRGWESWAQFWYEWTAAAFLRAYLRAVRRGRFLPPTVEELGRLLDAYLLEKALYEMTYELNNRPDWVPIPARGIRHLVDG